MKLRFDLNSIKYLKVELKRKNCTETIKLALKEKSENKIIAIAHEIDIENIELPQEVGISFVCQDGVYKTTTKLQSVTDDNGYYNFILENPKSLNYHDNRDFYRIVSKNDCIYTVHNTNGMESYNTYTNDISAGGVSIMLDDIVVSQEEMSLLIFLNDREIRTHLKFVRCDICEDGNYKLDFEYTDLSDSDYKLLSELCIKEQLATKEENY